MMKFEFETLAMRKNGGKISGELYESIEHLYMTDNDYHKLNGGEFETKEEFVKRVYGGKINTAKTILRKTIAEIIKENTFAVAAKTRANKAEMDRMNRLITEHYTAISKWN